MNRREFLSLFDTEKQLSLLSQAASLPASGTLQQWIPSFQNPWNASAAKHLYHRLGIAPSYQWLTDALQRDPSQIIDELFADEVVNELMPDPPAGWEEWLIVPPYLGDDHTKHEHEDDVYHTAKMDIRCLWTRLLTLEKIFFREKLLLFWTNHFVIQEQKVYHTQQIYHYFDYLRKNVWGNFKGIVKRVTIEPAMLVFLDGVWSEKDALNENYARELMELFTMGRVDKHGNPNYTQEDVRAVALAVTGWRFRYEEPGPNVVPPYFAWYYFDYETRNQPFGAPPKVYGLLSSNDPKIEADIIDAMFEYRGEQIAWFICTKLYKFFVHNNSDSPQAIAIIEELAADFQKDWELKPILMKLLKSEHFFDLTFRGSNIKSPYEFMLGMARQLNIEVTQSRGGTLAYKGVEQNQWLMDPVNVKGWPGYRTWLTGATLAKRNEYISQLIGGEGIKSFYINGHDGFWYEMMLWPDDTVLTWAKQFSDYEGVYFDFLVQISELLFAIEPSEEQLLDISKRTIGSYQNDWAQLPKEQKMPIIRKAVLLLLMLPEYHIC